MKKATIAIGAIAVVVAATIILFGNRSTSETITPNQVLTWDCEIPEFQPESIMLTCGDGGMYISNIKWNSWSSSGATGTATYNVNNCDPDCADGTMVTAPVQVDLSNLVTYKGKHYLRSMIIKTRDGAPLPQSGQSTYAWDVMEFAESMNDS